MGVFKIGKNIISSLFSKPATLMYPVIPRVYPAITRGQIKIDIESCVLCGICQKKCPTHAITVDRKKKEWAIERMQCIQCNCCVEVCPVKCLVMNNQYSAPSTSKTRDAFAQAVAEKPAPAPKAEVATEAPAAE